VAAREQNFGRKPDRLGEVSGDRSQRRQKEIPEAVAFQSRALLEAVLKQSRE